MLTAYSNANSNCYAWISGREEGPFFCKSCNKEVILRKGNVRVHHFAHKPPASCYYGTGESAAHHNAKRAIYEALKSHQLCTYCEIEEKFGDIIPDVNAIISGCKVAIEIQKSNSTVGEMLRRTKAISAQGFFVIWVIPELKQLKFFDDSGHKVCRVPKWLEFIHALNYGRVYVWTGNGSLVQPIHFGTMYREVPSNEFYDSSGEYRIVGGYDRALKDRKTVIPFRSGFLDLASNFKPTTRTPFPTKNYTIPQSNIWMDVLPPWWKK